jgi:hypothetical protein
MLIQTRYVGSNIALLIIGAVVCLATGFMAVMTAGFGADPVHDFKSGAILCDILAALLSVPFYLVMFRWCGVGSVGVWCTAMFSLLVCLVTGMAGPTVLFTLLLVLQGFICTGVNSASTKRQLQQQRNPL